MVMLSDSGNNPMEIHSKQWFKDIAQEPRVLQVACEAQPVRVGAIILRKSTYVHIQDTQNLYAAAAYIRYIHAK